MSSVFLQIPQSAYVAENARAFAIRDKYPVSPGHTLVIPRREVATWFDATRDEQLAILELVDQVKAALDRELQPDGYNVGFNAGAVAGQTVMHLHVHVIPRFRGDMDDPTGGVRHVIPSKGNYLREAAPLATAPPSATPSPPSGVETNGVKASGDETNGVETSGAHALHDFWRWAFSDLLGNTLRGVFAEWLVATACGVADGVREEWAAYDLEVAGIAVEVKSAAYVQRWAQRAESRISFAIAPTKAWDPKTGTYSELTKRQADVYVFCLLGESGVPTVDPLDTRQWTFFVLPTRVLNERVPQQKQIALSRLLELDPTVTDWAGLRAAIESTRVAE